MCLLAIKVIVLMALSKINKLNKIGIQEAFENYTLLIKLVLLQCFQVGTASRFLSASICFRC